MDFLVDSGADRTVFDATALRTLALSAAPAKQKLGGVGGEASSVIVSTSIRFTCDNGLPALFTGNFGAFTDPKTIDMSILGRDIANLFAVIFDRPQDVVCLLGGNHGYTIVNK